MLMRGASAIVQPSLFEGWSTVLEDALAPAKPVIASDFPVHIEQDLAQAIYFRRSDSSDCARAILDHYSRIRDTSYQMPDQREHMQRVAMFARSFLSIFA